MYLLKAFDKSLVVDEINSASFKRYSLFNKFIGIPVRSWLFQKILFFSREYQLSINLIMFVASKYPFDVNS